MRLQKWGEREAEGGQRKIGGEGEKNITWASNCTRTQNHSHLLFVAKSMWTLGVGICVELI